MASVGAGGFNSGLNTCTVRALPTEPSLRPQLFFFLKTGNELSAQIR